MLLERFVIQLTLPETGGDESSGPMNSFPRILITMGDVAGIGPEIIAKAWPELTAICKPVVVGDAGWLRRAVVLAKGTATVRESASRRR